MPRIIEPPLDQLPDLPTPLTAGERQVLELFDAKLPEAWGIYVQPHLNGLRPDFVLLNPKVGIAVFEVKDWNLDAMEYWAEPNRKGGLPELMARDRDGKRFSLEYDNPVAKVRRYKEEIYNLYCPSLSDRNGLGAITAGVIFTKTLHRGVQQLLSDFYTPGEQKYKEYYPMAGKDDLTSCDIGTIFPESNRHSSKIMDEKDAEYLRGWLKEPYFSREQRELPELNSRQRELSTTRTSGGYRRAKGPAGSGKSLALAARAAELADASNNVLVTAFNITMMNYLRDLTVRHRTQRKVIKRQIDFLHFHRWCRRVCEDAGRKDDYDALWNRFPMDAVLDRHMAELVQKIYASPEGKINAPYYDAILVDEGQDFSLLWWDALRNALNPGGEMLLVADKTQNIYGRAEVWTDEAMIGSGFNGPWFTLESAYRLPVAVIPLLQRYAQDFLSDEEVDIPKQMPLSGPSDLRWIQINHTDNVIKTCIEETRRQMGNLYRDTAYSDIVFISPRDEIGREFVDEFEKNCVNVRHTFDKNYMKSRRQKLAFWKGSPNIKATTVHSFKGWEARHLVVCVESIEKPEDRALFYTALTRLKQHENGSALTVVSSCPELREFGQSWPDFEEVTALQERRKDIFGIARNPFEPARIRGLREQPENDNRLFGRRSADTRPGLNPIKGREVEWQEIRKGSSSITTHGFKEGDHVKHPSYGEGVISHVRNLTMIVNFSNEARTDHPVMTEKLEIIPREEPRHDDKPQANRTWHITAGAKVNIKDLGSGTVQWVGKKKACVKLDNGLSCEIDVSLL